MGQSVEPEPDGRDGEELGGEDAGDEGPGGVGGVGKDGGRCVCQVHDGDEVEGWC